MFFAITAAAFAITLTPPPDKTPTESQMDRRVEVWESLAAVQIGCRNIIKRPKRGQYLRGCYDVGSDRIYLPSNWPNPQEVEAIRVHEHAHRVFGWRHD